MRAAAVGSCRLTPKAVHKQNHFHFGPIREVAFLFAGIFATMMPALGYWEAHGRQFGIDRPAHDYFAIGSLSAVLDNASIHLNFLKLAEVSSAAKNPGAVAAAGTAAPPGLRPFWTGAAELVVAVSLGAVFFGAMTCIGNGPNFMVKSVTEASGVRVPTFFGYILRSSLPILLPILAAGGWLFF